MVSPSMEELINDTRIADKKNGKNIMESSQLRNVMSVAIETDSLAVVENFIKYQIGRRNEWGHNDFGEKMLEQLDKIRKMAASMLNEHAQELQIQMARRYIGYLIRYFTYCQKGG